FGGLAPFLNQASQRSATRDRFLQIQTLTLRRLLDLYAIQPLGAVHAGGHRGEELLGYLLAGFRRIVVIEPNPHLLQELAETAEMLNRISREIDRFLASGEPEPSRIRVIGAAASEGSGRQDFFVTEASTLASLLRPNETYFKGRPTSAK